MADLASEYPLAHLRGVNAMVLMIDAMDTWEKATPKQRDIIREVAAPAVAALHGPVGDDRIVIDQAPEVHAPRRTLDSMRRKGMVDERGWLTMSAIRAAAYVDRKTQGDVDA